MNKTFSRSILTDEIRKAYASPSGILKRLTDITMPDNLIDWLSRLALLNGVPFNYLVADEQMLPPESIRFFYLDSNWVSALTGGAFSIGTNLSTGDGSPSGNMDKAVQPSALQDVHSRKPNIRAKIFGQTLTDLPVTVVTGFLLRSSLVMAYPSMGVNVYPLGGTPDDPTPTMLTILRLEQLGPTSDTLICLVAGDAYRIDIHEAPQALHYGIDCYQDNCTVNSQPAAAVKNLHTFTISSAKDPVTGTMVQTVTMSENVTPTDISSCFRTNSRVLNMSTLASLIATANNAPFVDSAEMGFEMTEGVGMVSFIKTN